MSSQGVNEVFSEVSLFSLVNGGLGPIDRVGMSFLVKEVCLLKMKILVGFAGLKWDFWLKECIFIKEWMCRWDWDDWNESFG